MSIITISNVITGEKKLRILETKIIEFNTIFSKNPNNPNVVSNPRLHLIYFLSVKTNRNAFKSTFRTNQHSFCFDRKYQHATLEPAKEIQSRGLRVRSRYFKRVIHIAKQFSN